MDLISTRICYPWLLFAIFENCTIISHLLFKRNRTVWFHIHVYISRCPKPCCTQGHASSISHHPTQHSITSHQASPICCWCVEKAGENASSGQSASRLAQSTVFVYICCPRPGPLIMIRAEVSRSCFLCAPTKISLHFGHKDNTQIYNQLHNLNANTSYLHKK